MKQVTSSKKGKSKTKTIVPGHSKCSLNWYPFWEDKSWNSHWTLLQKGVGHLIAYGGLKLQKLVVSLCARIQGKAVLNHLSTLSFHEDDLL